MNTHIKSPNDFPICDYRRKASTIKLLRSLLLMMLLVLSLLLHSWTRQVAKINAGRYSLLAMNNICFHLKLKQRFDSIICSAMFIQSYKQCEKWKNSLLHILTQEVNQFRWNLGTLTKSFLHLYFHLQMYNDLLF